MQKTVRLGEKLKITLLFRDSVTVNAFFRNSIEFYYIFVHVLCIYYFVYIWKMCFIFVFCLIFPALLLYIMKPQVHEAMYKEYQSYQ